LNSELNTTDRKRTHTSCSELYETRLPFDFALEHLFISFLKFNINLLHCTLIC